MKKEIRDRNYDVRNRIKTLKSEVLDLRKANDDIVQQNQGLNQKMAQNNAEILKRQGALEELEKQIA